MIRMKRILASFISVFMLSGLIPTNVYAESDANEGIQVTATEVKDTTRLDELETKPHESQGQAIYGDDEIVTVIVEMEGAPVMDYYGSSNYSLLDDEKTPGEAVSEFLSSDDVKIASEEIISNQENIVSQISNLLKNTERENLRIANEIEVVNNWTTIINGFAIRVPYGILNEVRELDGVKNANVEVIYDEPQPIKNSVVEEGKEVYSYSYDMVGVNEVWGQGYTGKEMLVAVLDSGLDLNMNWDGKVVRTHEAFTEKSFKSGDPTNEIEDWNLRYDYDSIEEFLSKNQLNSTTGYDGSHLTYDDNIIYKNLKVPYAWDYADNDRNVFYENNDHGTHVAGTIAGFASTDEGEVKFSGVSPDAQILFMKVFQNSGGGAAQRYIISALEDSLLLGADVINLSLGSSNGFANDDSFQNDMYKRVNKAGIVLMTSAGNAYKSSEGSNYSGNTTTSNPDESMISAPAIYDSNLSVASMENTINVQPYLTWTDSEGEAHNVYFNDPWAVAMKADFSDKEYPIYAVDGAGTYSDYYNAGFNNGYNNGKTGLALVKRGEISFVDKINNALSFAGKNSQGIAYGVLGVIVYDSNAEGTELITMGVNGTALDSAFISGKDGAEIVAALEAGYEVKIQVAEVDETVDSPTAGQMSSFTSWGAGPGLEIKPEITAPGGNIWSTVTDKVNTANEGYTGSYEMMSGTSMAAPHMTGIGTLIRQRVIMESAFDGISSELVGDVVSQLLVSTAIPKEDSNGVYYSVRQQGAGLVNSAAAVKTPAYISVDGEKVGKLELGDDPEKTGTFDISFNLNNISEENVKYNAEVVLMRPNTDVKESYWGERNTISDSNVVIKTVSLGEVTAAAGESVPFTQAVSITEAEKAELDSNFENGIYVEGYVILTDATDNQNPQLGLPMLAFYGDWTKAPIFDSSLWIDEPKDGESVLNNESNWGTSVIGSYQINDMYGVIGFFNLGQNIFDGTSDYTQLVYHEENLTLSPNGDEYFDRIDNYVVYQLRDAKAIIVEAKDAETGEVYMREWTPYSSRSLYDSSLATGIPYSIYDTFPVWYGTDMDGNVLPSGTKCIYTITAYGDGDYGDKIYDEEYGKDVTDFDSIIPGENEPTFNGHEMDKTGDVISFPVTIDTVAPKLENNAVTIYEENGRTYLTGTVYDEDGSIASIEVAPHIIRTYKEGLGDPDYSYAGVDRRNLFYLDNIYDPNTKEVTFTADVTEYINNVEDQYFNYEWTGNVIVSCGDYGMNDRSYAIRVDSTDGIVLSQTSALLKSGQKFELSVNNNSIDSDAEITRISSNPEVATINEDGLVTAIAPGQTTITVSNGTSSAFCIVAVEDVETTIESFELSLESFSGLKPDGQLVINVNNIQPANAEINEILWEVIEDEDFVNEFGSGLLGIGKNSETNLSGYLYLSTSIADVAVPGSTAEIRVTIDGIQRSMEVSWEDLYQVVGEDTLISGETYNDQSIYVTQGETTNITAKYRQSGLHVIGDVTTELTGLKLDGADFFNIGGNYKAKLVNEEGYGLPSEIKLYTMYSDYNVEIVNYPWHNYYTYDPTTGEIDLKYAPTGQTSKLLIVADGVEVEGAVAGTMSEEIYDKPDGLFGPFDWTIKSGNGELYVGEIESGGIIYEGATYKPAEPGVSYITATTKDGQYSVDFVVISEPVLAEKLTLDTNKAELKVGEIINPVGTLSPEPTNESDKELVWKSFNPSVATVSEDGTITAVSEGYAYIKVESETNNTLKSYFIVKVLPRDKYTVTFKDYDGTILKQEIVEEGSNATAPEDPSREGYKFNGWDKVFDNITEDLIVTAKYSKLDDGSEPGEGGGSTNPGDGGGSTNPGGNGGSTNPGGNGGSTNPGGNGGTTNPGSNGNNNDSVNVIPNTGGTNWILIICMAITLCSAGTFMLFKKRKEEI